MLLKIKPQKQLIFFKVKQIKLNKCQKWKAKNFRFPYVEKINLYIVSEEKPKKDKPLLSDSAKNITFGAISGKIYLIWFILDPIVKPSFLNQALSFMEDIFNNNYWLLFKCS